MRAPHLSGVSARRRRELALVFALIFGTAGGASRLGAGPVPFVTQPAISNGANEARSVYAADVDGDGDLDALSASFADDAVAWYENVNGDGTSWAASTLATTADGPRSVHAADVDGDGDVDVLSASTIDDEVAWYENELGDGTSWTPRTITNGADNAQSVHAADVDGDGDVDVLSASKDDDAIAWYANVNGDGESWTASTIASTADAAYSVYAADVDGDGDVDVLSASGYDDELAWYENELGDGTSWTPRTIATTANFRLSVYAADVDGDGDIDALSASLVGEELGWFENELGDGTSWTARTIATTAVTPYLVFAADVDGDGDVDALSASRDGDKIEWYENELGDGTSWTPRVIATTTDGALSVFAADVDGDGDLDVLSASIYDDEIAWYENRTIHRSALFVDQATIATTGDFPTSVHAADVDGDGDLDALSPAGFNQIAWYENENGAGSSWTPRTIATTANSPQRAIAADVDGDGDLDALSASSSDDEVAWYENENGQGTSWTPRTITSTADAARDVIAADVDGDGDLDVLSASSLDDAIAWYENENGDGTSWTASTIASTADGAQSVFAADVDGDGDLDVLSASVNDEEIAWYENELGNGTSWTPRTIATTAVAYAVFAADVDGDGDLDVVSASYGEDGVVWYENELGDGTSWTPLTISNAAYTTASVFAADLDGDGDVDVLSAATFDDSIAWYENELGNGTSWTARTIPAPANGAFVVFAADVDGDGDADALSASLYDDKIAWYPNVGGQFALPTTAVAQGVLANSQEDVALQIDFEHRGRAGDSDVELAALELRFEDGAGTPLTSTQANNLIDKLELYLDDGSGAFGLPGDSLVEVEGILTLVSGVLSIPLAGGGPAVQSGVGETKRYFVVVTMTSNAASQTPDSFELIHLTEASSSATDASTPAAPFTPLVPLRLEYHPDTETGMVDTDLTSTSCKAPFELDLIDFTVTNAVVCEAGTTLTAGDGLTVAPTGDLTLRAGQRVRFVVDFSVQSGGELDTKIDSSLEP